MNKCWKLSMLLVCVFMVNGFAAVPQWQPLFNGENLDGWIQRNGQAHYEVRDNTIVGISRRKTPNSFLCTEKDYGDFILEYDMKIEAGLNSGVQIRSLSLPDYRNGRVHGYQVEGDTSDRAWTGGIYDEARRGWLYPLAENPEARRAFKVGQWNSIRVEAFGPHIRTFVNGVPCADLLDDMTLKGFIGLQVHGIGNNESLEGKKVFWRNLRICTQNVEDHLSPLDYTIPHVNLLPNTLSEREKYEGWQLLFDGKSTASLTAFKRDVFPGKGWKIENGELIVFGGGGPVVTRNRYRNFEFKLDFKLSKGANSGIKYFIDAERTRGAAVGCEYQLLDDRNHPDAQRGKDGNRRLAALYDLIPASHPYNKRVNWTGWNQACIRVQGDHVEHWLNNMCVVKYQRRTPEWNNLVQQSKYAGFDNFGNFADGRILLQDHGDTVQFRSIKIRELPPMQTGKWFSLFDGNSFDHWTVKIGGHPAGVNYKDTFRAENGVLKVAYDQYDSFDARYGNIFYNAPFSHYKIRLEYRFLGDQVPGGPGWAFRNSGIMVHSQSPWSMGRDQAFPDSIEVQLLGGSGQDARPTGNLCTPGTHVVLNGKLEKKHCIQSTSPTYHGDQWVKCMVEVYGNDLIRHYINDELVMEYTNPQLDEKAAAARHITSDEGKLLHQGFIALQAESHPVEFRNIEILPLADQPTDEGFVYLFNGKDLSGWTPAKENPNSFSVQNNTLIVKGGRSHLFYTGPVNNAVFDDFELKMCVKTFPNSNSGVFFHTRYQDTGWPSAGYECQVNSTHVDPRKTGSLYNVVNIMVLPEGKKEPRGNYKNIIRDQAPSTDGNWFDYHIIVKGRHVTVKVDGETLVEYTEPKSDGKLGAGTFAIQAHDPNSEVHYRNIRVKILD